MAADAAVFISSVRYLAPIHYVDLADAALPAFYDIATGINSCGCAARSTDRWLARTAIGAVRS